MADYTKKVIFVLPEEKDKEGDTPTQPDPMTGSDEEAGQQPGSSSGAHRAADGDGRQVLPPPEPEAKRQRLTIRELGKSDSPPEVTKAWLLEMDIQVRGKPLEDGERVQYKTLIPGKAYEITNPVLPDNYKYVDDRTLPLVALLRATDMQGWYSDWINGKKPWPDMTEKKGLLGRGPMPWHDYLREYLPPFLSQISAHSKTDIISDMARGSTGTHKTGLGYGTPARVELTRARICPRCDIPVVLPMDGKDPTCIRCKMIVEEPPEEWAPQGQVLPPPVVASTTVVHTRLGTWMLHPSHNHWVLMTDGAIDTLKTSDAMQEWAVDLTDCANPLRDLEGDERNSLDSLLQEVATRTDTEDRGWSIGERLTEFFERSDAGRNNVEESIRRLGLGDKVKIHYKQCEDDEHAPEPIKTLSFHPMAAHLGSLMKAAGGTVEPEEEGSSEPPEDLDRPATQADAAVVLGGKGRKTRSHKADRVFDKYWKQAEITMDVEGKEGISELLSTLDPEGTSGLASSVVTASANQKADKEGKESAAKYMLDLTPVVQEEQFNTMRPYVELGMYGKVEWLDSGLDDWHTIQTEGAKKSITLERTLKELNRLAWGQQYRTPFMGEDCALWKDSPNLIMTSKPPTTVVERAMCLAGLCKKFRWERRHLYSTWYRRAGPCPEPDEEAASRLIHMDMRQCAFRGNHYGALALHITRSPKIEEQTAEGEDAVGSCYTWGNTLEETAWAAHKAQGTQPPTLSEKAVTEAIWTPMGPDPAAKPRGKNKQPKKKGGQATEPRAAGSAATGAPETGKMDVDPPQREAGTTATAGSGSTDIPPGADKLPPTPYDLYKDTWCPGPLVTPLLAKDAHKPDEVHWTRSLATYTFEHLLSENYLNCTLRQILVAWNSMPRVYQGGSRGTQAMVAKRRKQAEEQLQAHLEQVKDLLAESGVKATPTLAEFRKLTAIVVKNLAAITFGQKEAAAKINELLPAAIADSLEAMQTRSEYDERLSVPVEALMCFKMGEGGTVQDLLSLTDTRGKGYAVALRYYRCPWTFHIQLTAPTKRKSATWAGPFECNSVLAARSGWVHSQRSKNSKGARNVWQCNRCAGDWMKGRHGTRMVQVIAKDWMLQLILDEPPEALELSWRNDRVKYYQRLEPTEAPRDTQPYIPPKSKNAKALRLEDEASDRMWTLLLSDDHINELKHADEQAELICQADSAKLDRMSTAADITEPLLKLRLDDDKWMEGSRLQHGTVWVDTKGPGYKGHTKS